MKSYFIVILFLLGCKIDTKKVVHANSDSSTNRNLLSRQSVRSAENHNSIEDFDAFFIRFEKDSAFQISRIEFPLKSVFNSDGEETQIINRKEWKFTNFMNIKRLIVNKTLVNNNRILVLFSIEDTGVNVTYYFDKKKGEWWLTLIMDDSD